MSVCVVRGILASFFLFFFFKMHLFCPQLSNAFYSSECFSFEYENFHSFYSASSFSGHFIWWVHCETIAVCKINTHLHLKRHVEIQHIMIQLNGQSGTQKTATKRMQNEYNKKTHPCKMNNNRWEFIHLHFFVNVFSTLPFFSLRCVFFFLLNASLNLFCCRCFWRTVFVSPLKWERKSVRARHRILKVDSKTYSGDSVWIELSTGNRMWFEQSTGNHSWWNEKKTPIYSCKYCSSTVAITTAALEKEEEI